MRDLKSGGACGGYLQEAREGRKKVGRAGKHAGGTEGKEIAKNIGGKGGKRKGGGKDKMWRSKYEWMQEQGKWE